MTSKLALSGWPGSWFCKSDQEVDSERLVRVKRIRAMVLSGGSGIQFFERISDLMCPVSPRGERIR
jgi:hypothetical protein